MVTQLNRIELRLDDIASAIEKIAQQCGNQQQQRTQQQTQQDATTNTVAAADSGSNSRAARSGARTT